MLEIGYKLSDLSLIHIYKMTLKELVIGQSARILTVGGEGALRQHFLDMGVIPKAEVTVIKFAPMGLSCLLYTSRCV